MKSPHPDSFSRWAFQRSEHIDGVIEKFVDLVRVVPTDERAWSAEPDGTDLVGSQSPWPVEAPRDSLQGGVDLLGVITLLP